MNTLPFAKPWDALSEGLIYRFRLRPLSPGAPGDAVPFTAGDDELVVDCVFSPHAHPNGPRTFEQQGRCTTPAGEVVTFQVNDPAGGEGHGLRVFAGARWDPFIMDAPAALKTIATQKLAFTDPSSIFLDGKDVLSLVVELDSALLGGAELVGVVAETLTRGAFNVRIERVGRPEVKNMMLAPKQFDQVNRDLEIRDLYNSENAFGLADGYLGAYRARLNANLAFWDGLDGKTDWRAARRRQPSADRAGPRRLPRRRRDQALRRAGVVLEIELAGLRGEAHTTCGGRTLNDDVMDIIFTQLINAGIGPVIRDGVDRSTRPGTLTFPYLAEPNPDPPDPPEHH